MPSTSDPLWRLLLRGAAIYLDRDRRSNARQILARGVGILRESGFSGLRSAVASRVDVATSRQPALEPPPADGPRASLAYTPTISLIAAVQQATADELTACLHAVKKQFYGRWDVCIAFDDSVSREARAVLESNAREDARIRLVPIASSASRAAALRSALAIAEGEFVAIIDPADRLSADALPHYVLALSHYPDLDLMYSDEDKIDDTGKRSAPYYKPDWSPETLLADMYLGRTCVYRRSVMEAVDPFRDDVEGGLEYDLALRVTERTDRIHHIARVLCHRYTGASVTVADSRATHPSGNGELEALRQAIVRRGLRATVQAHPRFPDHHVVHFAADQAQKVSIVIPTRDRADLLEPCLESVFGLTTYPNFDVCVVDNGSRDRATRDVLERFARQRPGRFQTIRRDVPFNFSALVNAGVAATNGTLLVLLNNDTEVLDGSWLTELAGYAQRAEIGAVGCVLLYPNGTVQHGGVTLVEGAVATHNHVGQREDAPGYFGRLLAQANYAAVTGACMMVRRDVFVEAGGFDEQLAVSYNDVDFCLRLLGRGYRTVCLGQVRLLHHESLSRGSDDAADKRPRAIAEFTLMRERWAALLDRDPYYNSNLVGSTPGYAPAVARPRWIGSSDPVLLVAGHSHIFSFVDYFERSSHQARLAILDCTSFDSDTYWETALSEARKRRLPLAIVWNGNEHNGQFLLESDEPFSVFPAVGPWDDGRSRVLMPRSLIRDFFAPSVSELRTILAKSEGIRVILLGTPPPKSDGQIRSALEKDPWLAEWAQRIGMTASASRITPLPVRLELWRVTQELLRVVAAEFSTTFVPVPDQVFPTGALAADVAAADATHANGLWGEVMFRHASQALATR